MLLNKKKQNMHLKLIGLYYVFVFCRIHVKRFNIDNNNIDRFYFLIVYSEKQPSVFVMLVLDYIR